ncbi:MAG TPA: TIGR02466 family protein [Lichenihabitans sp.]|jgi:uncharacterized protein (TIGR02466 family)|nr:TIGR02466 family protein [Lichenihabitans sp.]
MTVRLNLAVRGLFATPVAALEVPDAEQINVALSAAILDRRERHPSVQASNSGGWHSDRDILEWGGPPAMQVIDLAKGMAAQLTADRSGQPIRPAWKVQAWANVNTAGHANVAHYHAGAFWSGTYYVDDGGCTADPSAGGEFEMLDPRGPGPGMYAPALKFTGDGASVGGAEIIRPKSGLLFLFPSWLMHQVRPYRGTGTRISIAFNFSVPA